MASEEFKLTVKKEILESTGYSRQTVIYKVGDTMIVDEDTFNLLRRGERVEKPTFIPEGQIIFDKNNFENEVQVTTVTVEYGVRKLGQRNIK